VRSQFFLGASFAALAFIFVLSLYRLATGGNELMPPPEPVLDRLEEGVMRGRLVFPDGTPYPYAFERDSLSFTALTSHPEMPLVRFDHEILADGRFAARPRPRVGVEFDLSQLEDFCVRFIPEAERLHSGFESLPIQHSAMAQVDPRAIIAAGGSDLGELTLGSLPPLMHLRVIDVAGEPIHGASVFVEHFLPGRTLPGEWRRRSDSYDQRTDKNGDLFLTGRDWADFFRYRPLGRGFPDATFESVRVRLNHPDHAPIYVEIDTDQFEHELRMPAAGGLNCEIVNYSVAEDLRIGVVRPGEAPHPTAWGLFSRRLRAKTSSYQVRSMLAGEVDVVITGQIGERELLRIPNVRIPANGESSDPRLMAIDFDRDLDWLELELAWPDGGAVTPEQLEEWNPGFRYRLRNGIAMVACSVGDGFLRIPMPVGGTLNGWVELGDMRTIHIQEESAGRRAVVVKPSLVLEWKYAGADEIPRRLDWSMQLVAPTKLTLIRQVGPFPDGRWTAALPESGEYTLEWSATLEGDSKRRVQMMSKQAWTDEELIKGRMHTIQVPPAFLGQIHETFEFE
jgi:hypothetical protein